MTHTFDSEVSLHYWLLWPTVRRYDIHSTSSKESFSKHGGTESNCTMSKFVKFLFRNVRNNGKFRFSKKAKNFGIFFCLFRNLLIGLCPF